MSNPFRAPAPGGGSFLPEDYIARKAETRANLLLLSLFAVVLAGVIGAFTVTSQRWRALKHRAEVVEAQFDAESKKIAELKAIEAQRAQIMEKAEITAALVERVPRWALLAEIQLRMPRDMHLEQLAVKSKRVDPPVPIPVAGAPTPGAVKSLTGKEGAAKEPERPKVSAPRFEYALTLDGSAEKNEDIADYLAALQASPVLQGVEMTFIREAKDKDRVLRKFEVTAMIRPGADTEALARSLKGLVARRAAEVAEEVRIVPHGNTHAGAANGKGD